ncbi:hypothetical protein MKL29_06775 [Streptococcus suis]|nr:hypothetical protein [Streptococcus suis]
MKWFFLVAFMGCLANALNISKKVNADDDDDDDDDYYDDDESVRDTSRLKEEVPWNKKEQTSWGIASVIFLILFLIFIFKT